MHIKSPTPSLLPFQFSSLLLKGFFWVKYVRVAVMYFLVEETVRLSTTRNKYLLRT